MSKEASEKHREIAAQIIADYGHDLEGLLCGAIAAALARAERDTFKRAAEIARGDSGEYDFQAALAEGRDFDYGFHNGKNHAGDSILADVILLETGESQ